MKLLNLPLFLLIFLLPKTLPATQCLLEPSNPVSIPEQSFQNFLSMISRGDVLITNRSYEDYMSILKKMGFDPQDYVGKLVIDIGAGVSNFTAQLLNQGVNAKALDLIFMKELGNALKTTPVTNFNVNSSLPCIPECPSVSIYWGTSSAAIVSAWIQHHPDFAELERQKRLIGASATDLPFAAESVDATVSFASVWGMPPEFYQRYLAELWRISKVGSKHYIVDGGRAAPILKKWGIPFRQIPLLDLPSEFAIVMERLNNEFKPHIFPIATIDLPPWPKTGDDFRQQKVYVLYALLERLRRY